MSAITWVPSQVPVKNNLTAWKNIFNDLTTYMSSCGLTQASDTGQLTISSVSSLPSIGTYAGYQIWTFSDTLQATYPIYMKFEFGVGVDGGGNGTDWSASSTPMLRVSVGSGTNGAGTLTGAVSTTYISPQNNTNTIGDVGDNTVTGTSWIVWNATYGFFGVAYGAGSRDTNSGEANGSAQIGATATMFVQRTHDASMNPTNIGVMVAGPERNITGSSNANNYPMKCQYLTFASSSASTARTSLQYRLGANTLTNNSGVIGLQRVWAQSPSLVSWNCLLTYNNADFSEGTQFTASPVNGTPLTFVALGNHSNVITDTNVGSAGCIAMLFQ